MSSSPSSEVPFSRNAATRMRPEPLSGPALPAEEAYAFAVAANRLRPAMDAPGHRLFWMSRGAFGSLDLFANDAFAVVGRHTHCDIVLPSDPAVSLRHLLVRSTLLDDGCPLLSVLDLHTTDGFEVAGDHRGARPKSVAATGALVLRVGAYVIVALPTGATAPPALPPAVLSGGHPYRDRAGEPVGRVTRVTMVSPIVHLSERPAQGATHEGRERFELLLLAPNGHARAEVSGADLDRGVLVGRAPKCLDHGMRALLDMNISRVHLLLLRGPRGVVAYDVASTQGVWSERRRVRSFDVTRGADVWLGNGGARLVVIVR